MSRLDSGAVQHNLYVKVVTGADPDRKSREITLQVLRFVHERLAVFAKMGLAVKVNRLRSQDLQNPRLVEAMRRRGVARLPALTTPNNVYLGFREIADVYERNIREFVATARRGERPVEGAAPEDDDLDRLFREEMTFERAEEDAGDREAGLGDTENMMDSYRHMMERREKSEAGRRPRGGGATARQPVDDRRAPPPPRAAPAPAPAPAPSRRPDNVGTPRRAADPDDAEFEDLINRLSQDIDEGTRSRAFASGGGDSLDDDGNDPQDDLMERAYFGSRVASTEM